MHPTFVAIDNLVGLQEIRIIDLNDCGAFMFRDNPIIVMLKEHALDTCHVINENRFDEMMMFGTVFRCAQTYCSTLEDRVRAYQ